jgi:signal peptidase II
MSSHFKHDSWLTWATVLSLVLIESCFVKPWVRQHALSLAYHPIPLLSNLLEVTATFNTGIAFSGLSHWPSPWVVGLTGLLVLALIGLITWQQYCNNQNTLGWRAIVWGAVVGGALANWVDRLMHGSVTDYLRFSFWPEFAIMNLADWSISLGATVLVLDALRQLSKRSASA